MTRTDRTFDCFRREIEGHRAELDGSCFPESVVVHILFTKTGEIEALFYRPQYKRILRQKGKLL